MSKYVDYAPRWYVGFRPRLLVRTCDTYRVNVIVGYLLALLGRQPELFTTDGPSNDGPVTIVLDTATWNEPRSAH
jgi:hypothetical protein